MVFTLLLALISEAPAGPCGYASTRPDSPCPRACVKEDWLAPYDLHGDLPHDAIGILSERLSTPGQVLPELADLIEPPEPCQLCVMQRRGSPMDILKRGLGGAVGLDVPNEEISFGHCFVCVQCPGEWLPTCRGWWPADPDGGDYEGDEGKMYDDDDEIWHLASCSATSREVAAEVSTAMETYEVETDYQVTNKGDDRSCTGFCTDMADRGGVHWRAFMGDYTIPGDLHFYSDLIAANPDDEMPDVFMNRLVEGFE